MSRFAKVCRLAPVAWMGLLLSLTPATGRAADGPVLAATEGLRVLDLPYSGLYSRPAWDTRESRRGDRLAFDVTRSEGSTSGRVVVFDRVELRGDQVVAQDLRVIPSDAELEAGGLVPGEQPIHVRRLVWDPTQVSDFIMMANGSPVASGGLPPSFGRPLALVSDRWDLVSWMTSGQAECRWSWFASSGIILCTLYESPNTMPDLCAISRPSVLINLTQTPEQGESEPIVSPDGSLVVFTLEHPSRYSDLALVKMMADASGSLTFPPERVNIGVGVGPAWSPVEMGGSSGPCRLLAYYRPKADSGDGTRRYDLCLVRVDPRAALAVSAPKIICSDVYVHTNVWGVNPPSWTADGRYLFFIGRDDQTDPVRVASVPQQAFDRFPTPYNFHWALDTGTILNKFVAVSPRGDMLAIVATSSLALERDKLGDRPGWPYLLALRWQ